MFCVGQPRLGRRAARVLMLGMEAGHRNKVKIIHTDRTQHSHSQERKLNLIHQFISNYMRRGGLYIGLQTWGLRKGIQVISQ